MCSRKNQREQRVFASGLPTAETRPTKDALKRTWNLSHKHFAMAVFHSIPQHSVPILPSNNAPSNGDMHNRDVTWRVRPNHAKVEQNKKAPNKKENM